MQFTRKTRLERIGTIYGGSDWWPSLVLGYAHDIYAGFDTILGFIVWTPRGPRRRWMR